MIGFYRIKIKQHSRRKTVTRSPFEVKRLTGSNLGREQVANPNLKSHENKKQSFTGKPRLPGID